MSGKRKTWLKVLWTVGSAMMMLLLVAFMAHVSARSGPDRYRARLVAAGEELSYEKLIPKPVPDELNSVSLFGQVITLLDSYPSNSLDAVDPLAMSIVAPGRAMIGWRQPDVGNSGVTSTWEELGMALDERSGALDLLHEMSSRPYLAFDLDYRDPVAIDLSHLARMKVLARFLNAATVIDLSRSNVSEAITHNRALYSILNAWTNEPLLISSLVRMASAAMGCSATWEILQAPVIDDPALAGLQSEFERMEFVNAAERALIAERAFISLNAERLRGSSSPFNTWSPSASMGGAGGGSGIEELWRTTRLRTKETLWKVGFSYSDELRALQGCEVLIDGVRAIKTNAPFVPVIHRLERELEAIGLTVDEDYDPFGDPVDLDPRLLISRSVLSLSRVTDRIMLIEVQRRLMITAIALKRYQQRHGEYPRELSALVPDFLKAMPLDPADGKPLRYRAELDGSYTLYSVGVNGTDEGGDPAPEPPSRSKQWQRGRDWVWPRPASESEIEAYRQQNQ